MRIMLLRGDCGGYELLPVNKRLARRQEQENGEESILFQTDWDFPSLARSLGWRGKIGREKCEHRGTDGTITCPDCGRTAGDFIAAAVDWLDDNVGRVFQGKGAEYFNL
jgi:hypothetical protein